MGNGMSTTFIYAKSDRRILLACLWIPLIALILFFGMPLLSIFWHSVTDDYTGQFTLDNYGAMMTTPGIWRAFYNSVLLGIMTTFFSLCLGFIVAYGIERTRMPGKKFIAISMSLPVLAPSLVLGLGLIFILGRNGIVGKMLGIRPDIYGFWGVLIADVLYTLPQAVLIIRAALRSGDARQYEAAEMLGASSWRQFVDITLPGMKYGFLSAGFVVFTVTITDFGNAAVIGGNFNVLATEIYNQVSGQMRFGIGAVVGILLLCPAALSLWIEKISAKKQDVVGAENAAPPVPEKSWMRDTAYYVGSLIASLSIVCVILTVIVASFIQLWPYKLAFTLKHYDIQTSDGYSSLWISIIISFIAAVVGTLLLFILTVGIKRMPGKLASIAVLLSAMPVAVPGLVLGLSYIFTFNTTMPWGILYGTMLLIALCNYYHHHTQGYAMMMTGIRNVPLALEDVTTVLGGNMLHILRDVYLPTVRTTLIAVALFLFMQSMVTLSAVIFLSTPALPLAAVTIMRLDEAGFTSDAAAFSTCIMLIVGTIALLTNYLTRSIRKR